MTQDTEATNDQKPNNFSTAIPSTGILHAQDFCRLCVVGPGACTCHVVAVALGDVGRWETGEALSLL